MKTKKLSILLKVVMFIGLSMFIVSMLFICGVFNINTKETNTETKIQLGMSNTETSYDMSNGGKFEGLKHNGYSAEVIHIEYLPDSIAQVFMSYAIYGNGNYKVSIYQDIEDTYRMELGNWSFGENQKTGVISFNLRQKENNSLIFETKIISDLPSSFSEPFTISTIKKEAVAIATEKH